MTMCKRLILNRINGVGLTVNRSKPNNSTHQMLSSPNSHPTWLENHWHINTIEMGLSNGIWVIPFTAENSRFSKNA